MADIRTKPATDAYRKGFKRSFKKKGLNLLAGIKVTYRGKNKPSEGQLPYPDCRKVIFNNKDFGIVSISSKNYQQEQEEKNKKMNKTINFYLRKLEKAKEEHEKKLRKWHNKAYAPIMENIVKARVTGTYRIINNKLVWVGDVKMEEQK